MSVIGKSLKNFNNLQSNYGYFRFFQKRFRGLKSNDQRYALGKITPSAIDIYTGKAIRLQRTN